MNFSWGNAFSDNLIKGYNFGKAVRTDRSQREYADRTKAIDTEEAEDKEALDAVRQAKFDELNDPNGKYASWTPEQKKAEIAKMDSLRDQGYSDASRASNVGRKQAMVDYYGAIGDIANADKSKTELRQAQWSQKFWDGLKGNSAAYDDQMIADLNADTIARIEGRQYSKDKNGNLIISVNGKMIGQPIQITDQMRAPFLQNLYATQYNREFGVAPTQQDATAWSDRKQAISTAFANSRRQDLAERKANSEIAKNNAIANWYGAGSKGGAGAMNKANWTQASQPGNYVITSNNPQDKGKILGWSIGNIQVPGSVPTEEAAIKVADDLKQLADFAPNAGSLQQTANGTKFVLNDGSAFFDNVTQYKSWLEKERTANPKGTSVTARKKKGQQAARQAITTKKKEEETNKTNKAFKLYQGQD